MGLISILSNAGPSLSILIYVVVYKYYSLALILLAKPMSIDFFDKALFRHQILVSRVAAVSCRIIAAST